MRSLSASDRVMFSPCVPSRRVVSYRTTGLRRRRPAPGSVMPATAAPSASMTAVAKAVVPTTTSPSDPSRRIGQVAGPPAVVEGRADGRLDRLGRVGPAQRQRSSIAADRIVPIGLAWSWPAMSGAEPWIGSYRPNVPCVGPPLAERRRRQHPEAPGQDGRLVRQDVAEQVLGDDDVEVGRPADQQHRARVDQLVAERRRPGYSARDLVGDRPPQARRREHVRLVDADVTCRAAPRASSKASRTIRADLGLGVRQRVERACRSPPVAGRLASGPRSRRPPVSSRTMSMSTPSSSSGRSGDDAGERRMDASPAAGWRTGRARRAGRRAPAPGGPRPPGRPTSGRRPRRAGSRRPSPQAVDVLGPDRHAVRVDRRAADEVLGPLDARTRSAPPAASTTRRAAATTSGPTPSPGIVAIR